MFSTSSVSSELNYRVITPRGDIPIKNIRPGDYVYNYLTNEVKEVKDVKRVADRCFSVIYSDGRILSCLNSDLVLDGGEIIDMETFKYHISNQSIKDLFTRIYYFNCDETPRNAALIGALYTYGDWSKNNINLPITPSKAYELYGDTYEYKLMKHKIGDNDLFTEFINPTLEGFMNTSLFWTNKIKYTDVFYREYFTEIYDKEKRTIPKRYMYGSYKTRNQFMNGVVDMGKHFFTEAGELTIYCGNKYIVKELQKMLWSMGIISTSIYSPGHSKIFGYDYNITIRKRGNKVPEFIYNIQDIKDINNKQNQKNYEFIPDFKVVPVMIKEMPNMIMTYNIMLDKPNQPFLLSNFMPKISL